MKSTVNKKRAFLRAYIACADLTRAAAAVKMDRSNHYDWLRADPEYAANFEEARTQAGQTLEDDAVRWARVGVFRQYTFQGRPQFAQRQVKLYRLPDNREIREEDLPADREMRDALEIQSERTITEDDPQRPLGEWVRSEGLMGRLLKAFMPQRYADRGSIELTGKDGGPVEIVERLNAARQRLKK